MTGTSLIPFYSADTTTKLVRALLLRREGKYCFLIRKANMTAGEKKDPLPAGRGRRASEHTYGGSNGREDVFFKKCNGNETFKT